MFEVTYCTELLFQSTLDVDYPWEDFPANGYV